MGRRKRARKWESSRLYSFVRARQLDGTINDYERPRVGVYVVTAARIYGSWGRVSQRRWPNWRRGDPWPPPIEPPELDRIAKHNRSLLHYRVRDLAELRQCLARSVPVRVAVPIDTRWYSAIGGKIEDPIQSLPFLGNHAIQAVQADDKHRRIRFWNNWGKDWGDSEYGYLSYEYFEKHMQDAWVFDFRSPRGVGLWPDPGVIAASPQAVASVSYWTPRSTGHQPQRFFCRRLAVPNVLGHQSLLIDLWDLSEDIRIGWCLATIRANWFEIEDFFIRPDQKMWPAYIAKLISEIRKATEYFKCRIRFWIPDADIHAKGGNFSTVNDLIRAVGLTVKPSGVPWAPYRGEEAG
jgi:hypothetical protein